MRRARKAWASERERWLYVDVADRAARKVQFAARKRVHAGSYEAVPTLDELRSLADITIMRLLHPKRDGKRYRWAQKFADGDAKPYGSVEKFQNAAANEVAREMSRQLRNVAKRLGGEVLMSTTADGVEAFERAQEAAGKRRTSGDEPPGMFSPNQHVSMKVLNHDGRKQSYDCAPAFEVTVVQEPWRRCAYEGCGRALVRPKSGQLPRYCPDSDCREQALRLRNTARRRAKRAADG